MCTSCVQQKTPFEILSSHKWKLSSAAYAGYTIDSEIPCLSDDRYTFDSNGIFLVEEGSQKCNVTDPELIRGSWALISTDNQILLDTPDDGAILFDIENMTSTRFIISGEMADLGKIEQVFIVE